MYTKSETERNIAFILPLISEDNHVVLEPNSSLILLPGMGGYMMKMMGDQFSSTLKLQMFGVIYKT